MNRLEKLLQIKAEIKERYANVEWKSESIETFKAYQEELEEINYRISLVEPITNFMNKKKRGNNNEI